MTRGIFAASVLAAALLFNWPLAAATQSPLITIPPAKLPPARPPASPASEAAIQPAASALLPNHVQVMHDPQGAGIVMYGALTGKAASAVGVLLGVFTYSQAFDPTPVLPLVITDQSDRHAQALFTAKVRGAPVTGIAVASLGDAGGDVSVFYDDSASFAASFPRLRQALAQSDGTGTVALSPIRLGDGGEISIPPGWRITSQGTELVELLGPQGESLSLGATFPVYAGPGPAVLQGPCCDPVAALQAVLPQLATLAQRPGLPVPQLTAIVEAQPTPDPDGKDGAFILANVIVGGRPYGYFALANAVASFADPWTFHLSGAMAPQPVFAAELPTLLEIWRSYSRNPPDFADHLQQALPNMDATQQLLRSTIIKRETADYNASAAWTPVLTAFASRNGGPAEVDNAAAQKLVDALSTEDGHSWRIVPPAELK
jgi:hypothetical protein